MSGKKREKLNQQAKIRKQFPWAKFIELLIIAIFLLGLPQQNTYALLGISATYTPIKKITFPTPAPYPINISGNQAPDVSAEGVTVLDVASGVFLYQKNQDMKQCDCLRW